jgi:quercetin dioxygenase-like cupin family protein
MTKSARVIAGAAAVALLVSACGAVAPAATAAPTATRLIVAATAQGAASVKLAENKLVVTDGVAPDLAAGNYMSTVQVVTLEKGGRSVAHKHGGIETIYVLQGTIDLRLAGGTRLILSRGQGTVVPPGTVLQMINSGDATAKVLASMTTAESAPFQTNVDEAP